MKELLHDVELLKDEELSRAYKTRPLFHSNHEGVAVLEEEVMEAFDEFDSLTDSFICMKKNVFRDGEQERINDLAAEIEHYAIYAACELIQVAAVARKCIEFRTYERRQEGRKRKLISVPAEIADEILRRIEEDNDAE